MGESSKKERNFTIKIDLNVDQTTTKQHQQQQQQQQPKLEIQSPKTPTLSRKLKAISLDSSDQTTNNHQMTNNNNNSSKKQHLDVLNRDFISMPNTPKRQIKYKSCEFNDNLNNDIDNDDDDDDDDYGCCSSSTNSGGSSTNNLINHNNYDNIENNSNNNIDNNRAITTTTLLPNFSTNLKKFASNSSISGSQTLKTLPEVMTLHDFNNDIKIINRVNEQPIKIKAKGLLERRGSNASLTIDLSGSNSNICDSNKTTTATTTTTTTTTRSSITTFSRLNTAKSVSNLNLTSFGGNTNGSNHYCCNCKQQQQQEQQEQAAQRRKSQETCNNCTIYEFEPSKFGRINKCLSTTRITPTTTTKRCDCNCVKYRRKSLSNENLYVPLRGCCQINGSNGFLNHNTTTKQYYSNFNSNNSNNKNYRRAHYPRQPDLETLTLSEDFKIHLQNVQYLQTAGSVLSIDDLRSACEMSRVPKLHSEFWEVPLNLQEKSYVPGSHSRNRYKGVLPNEHSRVHLPGPQSYIHANYIRGPDYTETVYIATQGPMAHTCLDFWEMIWHTNCICIVMLTGLIEKGRNKCELYFPLGKKDKTKPKSFFYVKTTKERDKFTFGNYQQQENCEEIIEFEELNELTYGDYTIKYLDEDNLDECIIRRLEIVKNNESRIIKHYWYPNWQDHKISNPEQLLKIALNILDLLENKIKTIPTPTGTTKIELEMKKSTIETNQIKEIPLVVHCSAGIGRTGCFLAILNGIQQLKQNLNVDVLAILCSLRLNRGGMVQTAEQYELIHRVLNLFASTIETTTTK